ncbi:unnamed protein product [Lymnaea stagnalis]|uniref:CUB domain-containing protein n=1 Tax=Lymnaea stagnalis TaxID=6523 RepID=A0AAV2I098_LYMST
MGRAAFLPVLLFHAFHLLDLAYCDCNQKYVVKSGDAMEVVSQNYPHNYSRNAHCFYDFSTEYNSGDVIRIRVLEVTMPCKDDQSTLEVFDAFNTSPRYLGRICQGGDVIFTSPKERMYLVFKSGGREPTGRGFKLKVEGVPEFSHCYKEKAKVLNVLHEPQQLVSPYYPFEVAPNVHCRWLLKAPQGHKITLEILHADMKGSSDCVNFGFYIFDGKTTYDDERVAQVCDNPSGDRRTFDSSSNYLLVVFSSGPHVLYSGGGVKLAFYSTLADHSFSDRDHTLLFILVGVLLGIASFTIIMIIVRFFVVPARRKAMSRDHGRRSSRAPLRSVSTISTPTEPPPPYRASEGAPAERRFAGALSNLFKPHRESSDVVRHSARGVSNSAFSAYDFGPIPDQADVTSINNAINLINSGIVSPEMLSLNTRVFTPSAQPPNDHRELPNATHLRPVSGRRDSGHYETVSGVFAYLDTYPDSETDNGSIHLNSGADIEYIRSQLPAYELSDAGHGNNDDRIPERTRQKRERIPTPDETKLIRITGRPCNDVSIVSRHDDACRPESIRNEKTGSSKTGNGIRGNDIDGVSTGSGGLSVHRLELSQNGNAASCGESRVSSAGESNRLGHQAIGPSVNDALRGSVDADGYEIPASHYDKPNVLNRDEEPEYQTLHYDIVQL